MYPQPPLLILSQITDDFDLAQLPWCESARDKVTLNRAKFRNLEMVEIIVDAMPFVLTRRTADETREILTGGPFDLLFCDLPPPENSAIGVAPGDNLADATRIPEVHQRLLLLGKWIGESLNATAAAWMPAWKLASFAWFTNAVDQYLADGRFPLPFHISFSEIYAGQIATQGLRYFTGQEIHLTVPPHYEQDEVSDRVTQIAANIVAHGRIDRSSRSQDVTRGETLIYTPTENLEQVNILIRRDAPNGIAAER